MFTDAKESSTVLELKHIVEDILRWSLDEQRAAVQGRQASGRRLVQRPRFYMASEA